MRIDLTPSEGRRMKEPHLKLGGSGFRTEKGGASLCNTAARWSFSSKDVVSTRRELNGFVEAIF